MDLERVDPRDLGLDTAEEIAALHNASQAASGLPLPTQSGPQVLKSMQLQSDSRPVDALWLVRDAGRLVGGAAVELPWRENTGAAYLRGEVHPDARRRGLGRALLQAALGVAADAGRCTAYAGAFEGSAGVPALEAMGFRAMGVNAVRRLDLHEAPAGLWDRLREEALGHAGDYELVRQVGSTPADRREEMVALHAAINDAPMDDPEMEEDVWDVDRLTSYENAMAGRRQTLYRVMARHRTTGDWAGQSLLCVDEFAPATAFQEDTSVVRAHRGHRLGLLMKLEMIRWLAADRPEVACTDTWNSTRNHHMIAVNERLGARVIARHVTFRTER